MRGTRGREIKENVRRKECVSVCVAVSMCACVSVCVLGGGVAH